MDASNSARELEEYVKEEIAKSGFPLEIFVATVLEKHGWDVVPHLIYPVKESGFQELDVHAKKAHSKVSDTQDILIIECKKQEKKPWIFFEQDKPTEDVLTLNLSPYDYTYGWYEENQFKSHFYYNAKPCSYHFPSFQSKGGHDGDVILKAINQVLDALIYWWETEMELFEKVAKKRVSLLYPVIVLDGKLFSARISSDGNISLNQSNHLQLRVARALREPLTLRFSQSSSIVLSIKNFIIDIIEKDFFESYLNNFSE